MKEDYDYILVRAGHMAVLAHNLIRWIAILGNSRIGEQLVVARTVRTRILAITGRIVDRAGRPTVRLPINWPWTTALATAIDTLRCNH